MSTDRRMPPIPIVGAAAMTAAPGMKRLEELVFEAARAALDDAGIDRDAVDAVVLSASDELDGRSISSMLTSAPAGGLLKDTVKITDSGLHGVAASLMRIHSGDTDLEVVVSWGVPSECDPDLVERTMLDPFVERHAGVSGHVGAGIMLEAYLSRFDRRLEEVDARADSKWAAAGVSADDRDDSFVAVPLRRSHIAPAIDAVAAVVVASSLAVERHGLTVRSQVTGIGWAVDEHSVGHRDLSAQSALQLAAHQALARAGIAASELEAVEIEDRTVLHELLAVEAFELAEPGGALDLLAGAGAESVNRYSGDGFGGLPMHCSGLWRLAHVCRRDGHGAVAVQNSSGVAAQSHAVVIVEGANAA